MKPELKLLLTIFVIAKLFGAVGMVAMLMQHRFIAGISFITDAVLIVVVVLNANRVMKRLYAEPWEGDADVRSAS